MKRLFAVVALVMALSPPARAQTQTAQQVAFIIRVPMISPLDDPADEQRSEAATLFDDMTRSLDRWSEPPLDRVPVALAVSPALCDELVVLDPPAGRPLLRALRELGARADVLTVPYADVWLPFLPTKEQVSEQLTEGADALSACLGRKPAKILFGHTLTGPEPVEDLDDEAVAAVRDLGITTVVARGPTQTAVRSDRATGPTGLELVPWHRGVPPLTDDGALRDAPLGPRVAVVTDASDDLARFDNIERLATSVRVQTVSLGALGDDAPRVSVAFPLDPRVEARTRRAVDGSREVVEQLRAILEKDDPLRTRLKTAYAYAIAQTSSDEYVNARTGSHRRSGRTRCERLSRFAAGELAKVTVVDGSVTFTSRRGSVPVTVSNTTSYPVRVRVSVQSSKLSFPREPTVVRTIEPPGETVTFEALARSSGTFPVKAVLRTPGGRLKLDDAQLTVRSAAANLPVLILTIGGALFLMVVYGRRIGRRRRAAT